MTRMSLSVRPSLYLGMGLFVCSLVSSAAAQPAAPTVPYEGEIVGTQVNIRSGPSTNYYGVTRLGAGTRVKVYEEKFGWLAIAPPDGVFSYISKDMVTLTPDGKIGTVTGENVLVRCGSTLNDQKTSVQSKLQRGDKVSVLGESAGFLKIMPPDDARVYVSADYVAKIGGDGKPIGKPTRHPGATTQAATTQSSENVGVGTADVRPPAVLTPVAVVPPPSDDDMNRQQTKLGDVENRMSLILRRPVLEQTFEEVEPVYKELATSQDIETTLRAKARLEQISRIRDNQKLLTEMQSINNETTKIRSLSQEERDKERAKALQEVLKPRAEFIAQGKLDTSSVYADMPGPKRYRLRNPETGQTIAYVEVVDETRFDIRRLLGAVVGIMGRREFDARNNVSVIYPEEITLLSELEKPTIYKPKSVEPSNSAGPTAIEMSKSTTQPAGGK